MPRTEQVVGIRAIDLVNLSLKWSIRQADGLTMILYITSIRL